MTPFTSLVGSQLEIYNGLAFGRQFGGWSFSVNSALTSYDN